MKAIGFYRSLPLTDPESLLDLELEKPTAQGRDLLVKVQAISVNPIDVKVRASKPQAEHSAHVIGWDAAGIVEAIGPDCTLFQPGDHVYYAGDLTRPGTNSEYHLVDEQIVGRKPTRLDFAEAAALPLTTLTAWEGLFDRLGISKLPEHNRDKRILIIGTAGGVGSIATQLAKWAGLTVVGTASRPESQQWAREHGADYVIDYRQSFVAQLESLGIATVDFLLCLNSAGLGKRWKDIVQVMAPQGKICNIDELEEVNLAALKSKSVTYVWEFMFTHSMYQTVDMIEQHHLLDVVADLVDAGKIQTSLTRRLSPITVANLRKAHELVEKGTMIGKVVLEQF
jgi:zinc-binding alcohol dehydrogenase family protein